MPEENKEQIIPVSIEDEMTKSYINYAIYVLTHRALPNVYDGLKPVQRRILVAFHQTGLFHNKPYKKTVTIVGETMGKYHPHGDAPIYQALVRLAQPWVMRYPLVDGQGNFGSMDGDDPAAMRYTECRTKRLVEDALLADLSKEIVAFQPNFDNSLEEPIVLPALLPILLINGSTGIAVGMATHMPPHNLREVVDGVQAYIDNPDITLEELLTHIKGPDFPTGGIIYGYEGIRKAFETGKGRVVIRGKTTIETLPNGREQIVATEVPYMVNKAHMLEKTANLVNQSVIEGISDIRDESDKTGPRIVYELKRDVQANIVLNNLYKHTELQSSFNVNNVALVDGTPKLLTLQELVKYYVQHRHTIVKRRTEAELKRAKHQLHIQKGYLIVINNLDAIVRLIKTSKDAPAAQKALGAEYSLTAIQAKVILEMRLQRLTSLECDKVKQQHEDTTALIKHLESLLADKSQRMELIKKELQVLRKRYGDDRRTVIEHNTKEFSIESMIPNETMVITHSQQGYIKSTLLSTYRLQHRGGVGSKGTGTKAEDFVDQLLVAEAHDYLLMFTEYGKVYWKRVYELPQGGKKTQGRAMQNLLSIAPGDVVRSILVVKHLHDKDYVKDRYVTLCTEKGIIKKTPLAAFARPLAKGIKAIRIVKNDRLIEAKITESDHYIVLATRLGKAIRFKHTEIRSMGRPAMGVRGITLANAEDRIIGMLSTPEKDSVKVLVISEKGYGKCSAIKDYRCTHRGGKGIKTLSITSRTGFLTAMKAVEKEDQLMIMSKKGITLRTAIKSLRPRGRNTQGVRMLRQDNVAAVAVIKKMEDEVAAP